MTTMTMARTGYAVTNGEGRVIVILAGVDAKDAADRWAELGYAVTKTAL
jgi:hypothetical protein